MAVHGNLHVIPILISVIAPITFTLTFFLAVYFNHVYFALPYISDTGNLAPESCIFSQLLNVTALLLLICVYIRYLQVSKHATFRTSIGPQLNYNSVSWYFGSGACLGMSMVANFQVMNLYQLHYVGACLCFMGGTIYFVFQTIFSYHMSKIEDSRLAFYVRLSLCSLSTFFLFTAVIPGIVSSAQFDGDSKHWKPNNPGYDWHVASALSEWLMALTQCLLVLTFLPEYRRLIIHMPKMEIKGIHKMARADPS